MESNTKLQSAFNSNGTFKAHGDMKSVVSKV